MAGGAEPNIVWPLDTQLTLPYTSPLEKKVLIKQTMEEEDRRTVEDRFVDSNLGNISYLPGNVFHIS